MGCPSFILLRLHRLLLSLLLCRGGLNLYLFDFQRLFDEILRKILSMMSQEHSLVLFEFPYASHLKAELIRALIEEMLECTRFHLEQPEKVVFDMHEVVIVVVKLEDQEQLFYTSR